MLRVAAQHATPAPLLKDQAAIMMNERRPHLPAKVRRLLASLMLYAPEKVYLFGSWARGEADELSDIDVVLIKETPTSFHDRLREVAAVLPPELGSVDILVYTPDEFARMVESGNAFAEMIREEGILIYEREASE